jgi:heme a synthase
MPFDTRTLSAPDEAGHDASPENRRLVAAWLFTICGMILIMVALGGLTRLTGAGLSIMEWRPVAGALPPLNHAEWEKLFALYKGIPQYQILHPRMGLAGFQGLFWMEWVHRLWGRLIGVAFLVPLVWFWATGRVERRLRPWLALLFLLGGLQGAIGWFMVASGFFPDSTAVAPIRLAVHLALALALYAAILWTGMEVLRPAGDAGARAPWLRRSLLVFLSLLMVTIVAGSLVAGTQAGFEFNTFPLMEGHLLPSGYARLQPFVRNLTQNLAAVQFDHRILATLTALAGAMVVAVGLRHPLRRVRRAVMAVGALVVTQYLLGVATLLLVVPVPVAVVHQTNAVLVLTGGLYALHATRVINGIRD